MESADREKILALLESDAKTEIRDIAAMLCLNETDVADEIRKMEDERVICGYHAFVNWDKTDDEKISALIELKVMPQKEDGYDKIAEKIYRYPEVETLYLMSGSYDFMVVLKKATMRQIATFVASKLAVIEEVKSTTTHIVLERYKDHGISLTEPQKDLRMVVMP